MIRVFDAYGREYFITKEAWRRDVLPDTIKSNWDKPDDLFNIIRISLDDGSYDDVVKAAERLHAIEDGSVRSTCLYGFVLMKTGRPADAEKVYLSCIKKRGEDGYVLSNLAKVYWEGGDKTKAENVLWHSLELDPNQDVALAWYSTMHRERDGEPGALAAFRRIAKIPGSWLAQLWLARSALQSNNFDDALSIYRAVLSTSSTPPPTNMLMQISGDLGNAGRLVEILQEVGPHFDAQAHGLTVGNNLMKAYVQLGDFAAAKLILDELYALKRMDWKPTLAYWETEIAKSRIAANRVAEQGPLNIGLAGIDGPVWLRSSSPALKLFPVKSPEVPVIAFLGSSAETTNTSKNIQPQMADGPGRMSRALPLCLAEHVYFHSLARVLTLVPRVAGLDGGFVLSGVPWPDKDAAKYGVTGPIECLYVVLSHIDTRTEPWTVELRLIRTSDGECVRSIVVPLTHTEPEPAVRELTNRLMASLFEFARLDTIEAPPAYDIPTADQFSYYLLRLEQLLAVVCAAPDGVESRALSGEREIIDGNILLCLGSPASVTARIMLAQTLLSMKHVRPEVVAEYKDKVALLQKEKHLPDSASNTIVQRIFDEAFTPADPSVSA